MSGCGLMDHSLLHPDHARVPSNSGSDDIGNIFGTAEDIDDFERFRDFIKARICLFTENFGFKRVDRNDSIPGVLHVLRYRIAGPPRVIRETDHRDRVHCRDGQRDLDDPGQGAALSKSRGRFIELVFC